MSLNPVFSELALKNTKTLNSQSIVESRIAEKDSDIVKILAVGSNANVIGSETVAGEVRYSGRAIFSLVYQNSEGELRRSEYGVEFSHKAERADILPSMKAEVFISTENTELKQLNGSYILSAIASADIELSAEENYNYLSGGEGIICRSEENAICRNIGTVKGGYELFEEIDAPKIGSVLMHYENVVLTDVQSGVGCIIADGAVSISMVCLTATDQGDEIHTISKVCEFRFELESDDAMPGMPVSARAAVKGASIAVTVDEAKAKSIIAAEVGIDVSAALYENVSVNAVSDVYSTQSELSIFAESVKSERPFAIRLYGEKFADTAIITSNIDFSTDIIGITGENVNIQATASSGGAFTVEGVITALAVVKNGEGKVSSVTLELPFAKELALEGVDDKKRVQVSALAHGISARQKKEGEIEMEANLKIFVCAFENDYLSLITQVTEGDELIKESAAISVFIPERNDGLWDVAKRLNETPEDVVKYNSELVFPLKGDERIVFYRREKIDY